ncbi:hypothetical protein M422DRAFT_784565 [Sphaerobolus stellatus SS14]|uniref:Reverse transcriptase domain-containing protein n=1 Tax=Sphaerobolus stellatus (strain SS14) TaxID=990650 RepID=A0A0C9USX6_SPHS4|nr:hypothetical protein M422DRAFT_784565 [Sphaerobolus stellatus SS14]
MVEKENIDVSRFGHLNIQPTQAVRLGSTLHAGQLGASQASFGAPPPPPPGQMSSSNTGTTREEASTPSRINTSDSSQPDEASKLALLELQILELRRELLAAKASAPNEVDISTASAVKEQSKVAIPDIIPGFKSNPLALPLPPSDPSPTRRIQPLPIHPANALEWKDLGAFDVGSMDTCLGNVMQTEHLLANQPPLSHLTIKAESHYSMQTENNIVPTGQNQAPANGTPAVSICMPAASALTEVMVPMTAEWESDPRSVDLSFPRNNPELDSVNATIDADALPTEWGSFERTVELILSLPEGCVAATFDIEAAYRVTPVRPSQQNWRPAQGLRLMIKWVDDFFIIRLPQDTWTEEEFMQFGKNLGVSWSRSKLCPFTTSQRYIGFDWDLKEKRVSFPLEKLSKLVKLIDKWLLPDAKFNATKAAKLHGKLVHASAIFHLLWPFF